MVLYYAFGGGLGHLTRASAVMYTLGYQSNDFFILTSSEYASLVFKEENIVKFPKDLYAFPGELKVRIESIIIHYKIDVFFIDSFPFGINGELNNLQIGNCRINYIARLLNWTNYCELVSNFKLRIDTSFIVEKLPDNQLSFILNYSNRNQYLDLKYPTPNNFEKTDKILAQIETPFWLIVHSGDFNELNLLYQYAKDLAELENQKPNYLIISQVNMKDVLLPCKLINYYPASEFFTTAEKIFTGCGFNAMAQTVQYIDKHHFIPFKRRFDDQFIRATYRKVLIRNLK